LQQAGKQTGPLLQCSNKTQRVCGSPDACAAPGWALAVASRHGAARSAGRHKQVKHQDAVVLRQALVERQHLKFAHPVIQTHGDNAEVNDTAAKVCTRPGTELPEGALPRLINGGSAIEHNTCCMEQPIKQCFGRSLMRCDVARAPPGRNAAHIMIQCLRERGRQWW
jgi:hypothetical protein